MSPRKPQLLHMKSFSPEPGNSCPGTPRSASSTWLERRQSLLQSITQHEFSPVYNPVHPIDFIFKLVQLMVTIVCTGAYSEGVYQATTSTTAQMMPYFVCSAYLIISSVILIGYVLGHSMPDLIIRIFNTLAGMLFLAAGLFALQNWRNQIALESDKTSELEDKEKVFLLATGLLCLVNTCCIDMAGETAESITINHSNQFFSSVRSRSSSGFHFQTSAIGCRSGRKWRFPSFGIENTTAVRNTQWLSSACSQRKENGTMAATPTQDRQTKHEKPKLPLLQLKPLALSTIIEDGPPSCSTPKSSVSWVENPQFIQDNDSENEASGNDYILPSPCIFKLVQVIVTIVCSGLYSEGMHRVEYSTEAQLFPKIICLDYLIITPVILLSYLMGKRMPELLIRIFNLLGFILFFVAGAISLQGHRFYIQSYLQELENMDDENEIENLTRQGVFLLASGVLCLINAVLYITDFAWSIHYTVASF
ncbi:hypothetical protein C0J52_00179 [Blattella germanica]|nr:hypothetical protein C0J52_00179 [Blattella germanica]